MTRDQLLLLSVKQLTQLIIDKDAVFQPSSARVAVVRYNGTQISAVQEQGCLRLYGHTTNDSKPLCRTLYTAAGPWFKGRTGEQFYVKYLPGVDHKQTALITILAVMEAYDDMLANSGTTPFVKPGSVGAVGADASRA